MTTTTIPKFNFTLGSIAAAEARLKMKITDIIAEMTSDTGLALRTLRTLMAAGLSPYAKHRALQDMFAEEWIVDSEHKADRLIMRFGTAACAAAVGPDLGAFLLTLEGPRNGR